MHMYMIMGMYYIYIYIYVYLCMSLFIYTHIMYTYIYIYTHNMCKYGGSGSPTDQELPRCPHRTKKGERRIEREREHKYIYIYIYTHICLAWLAGRLASRPAATPTVCSPS